MAAIVKLDAELIFNARSNEAGSILLEKTNLNVGLMPILSIPEISLPPSIDIEKTFISTSSCSPDSLEQPANKNKIRTNLNNLFI